MLDAAKSAQSFIVNRCEDDLHRDLQLLWALVRAIEIIGEAAMKVSTETRNTLPNIPWTQVVAMRNKLIHGYYDVNPRLVWKTMIEDIPPLIEVLVQVLR